MVWHPLWVPRDSSFFLCKYFVGRRLSRLRAEWAFLRDNSAPSVLFPRSFYDSCISILSEIADTELSSKKVYLKLLQSNSSAPILSCHWSPFVNPVFQLSEHWSFVRDNFTENHKNDLLWLILLHAVKVRDSLKNWGVIGSGVCACCPRLETTAHCFLTALVKRCGILFLPCSPPNWIFNLTLISRLSFSLLGHLLVLKFLELRALLLNPFSMVFGVSATKLPFSIM